MSKRYVVAADGTGEYRTVQSAVDAVPAANREPVTIYIKNGVYEEKLTVPAGKRFIRFEGESKERTVLTYGDYASKKGADGKELGTTGSSSTFIYADDFTAENITFRNTAGPAAGQAVALYVRGDRAAFRSVRIIGHQDTLYTPGEGRQYYKDCYIEGTVDYIFGSATAFFDQCVIHSTRSGFVTAANTPENAEYGYVFKDCPLTGNTEAASVYLGRPWRPFARVVFTNAWMDAHIKPEGWHNWGDPEKEKTAKYAEHRSTGPGANPDARVGWSSQWNDEQAASLTVHEVLGGKDHWNPAQAFRDPVS
ncbi:Pectinesterase A [Paenibacillus allorhizosphaerae]|uniref:Pectinesterase n=2 Tax=Paenibacillus allorhizosphaerae TaxID=2849866 RepID=A0ABM8VBZ3_9BACL|nr:Pectinesterase A [Paenibacillus allorhizosphaerae]